jgi:hypothetical protein
MTREEAITILQKIKPTPCRADGKSTTHALVTIALDMAIKALEQSWIPCSKRLPEEDTEVLIAYRYKEGEGDTSHTYIDITTYGDMYFGGNLVYDSVNGNRVKYWRQPFEYFTSNYEVIAWMPLPEQPYKAESEDKA